MSIQNQKPIVIRVEHAAISSVLEFFDKLEPVLGYSVERAGIQCIEDVEDEIKQGGVWIIAPGQGPCSKGEAYKISVPANERMDVIISEVKAAIQAFDSIYLWIYYINTRSNRELDPDDVIMNIINDAVSSE